MENIFNTYFDFIIDLYLFCYIYYINFNRINKIKNITKREELKFLSFLYFKFLNFIRKALTFIYFNPLSCVTHFITPSI